MARDERNARFGGRTAATVTVATRRESVGRTERHDHTRADIGESEAERSDAVVVASARGAEGDLVAVGDRSLSAHALAIDVSTVQAPEVTQEKSPVSALEDAVLLRGELVEKLDRAPRMPPETVRRPQGDRLLSRGGREDQAGNPRARSRTERGSDAFRSLVAAT